MSNDIARALHTEVDLDLEKAGIKAHFGELLAAGRSTNPMIIYYRGKDRMVQITSRPTDDDTAWHKALHHMLALYAAVRSSTALLALQSHVTLATGDPCEAVVMTAITPIGALSEAFPFRQEEDASVTWLEDDINTSQNLYSKLLDHMFPVYMSLRTSTLEASEILEFLASEGFEVEFHGEYHFNNINVVPFNPVAQE